MNDNKEYGIDSYEYATQQIESQIDRQTQESYTAKAWHEQNGTEKLHYALSVFIVHSFLL